MRKCANISPYMRRPLVIYYFATAPFWISLYIRKILFYFLSVYWILYLRFFWFRRYIPTVHYVLPVLDRYLLLYFLEFGIWNLESGSFSSMRNSVCKYIRNSAKFRGIPANFTAKNTAEFRGIPYVFQKIPYSVGSQKCTSVDTLPPTPGPLLVLERRYAFS